MLRRQKLAFGVVLGVILIIALWGLYPASTPPIKDDRGNIVPQSIATLEKIQIGGMDQWILIRGRDTANPVLLWLHGGPGAAQIPIARHYNGILEDDFIVVHWDQRGAGKSNPRDFDEQSMAFEQFISDTHELTQYLKERFNREQIFLVGHSWGSQLGIKVVQSYPEDYHAFVGVSQTVDSARGSSIAYAWLREQFEESGNTRELQRLEELGLPPYTDHQMYVKFAQMIISAGGGLDVGVGRLAVIALRAPEYRAADYVSWLQGSTRGSGAMWEETREFNMFRDVPQIMVPIYFFSGVLDYNTPFKLVKQYYAYLDAPYGKQLVRFEESAHAPFMAEAEKFNQELVRVKEEIIGTE
ncbi:alpha/beta fold hydrolase [Dethiobacter alkaliphilus]|uniref:prolyl aminopeptidase n=1 Tax=Dethiobacter alkaliphilus AHT 1 TaxID=555088 RepID=C0GD17_DETAL|nr:alpha/beta hydrolase [Dethiobacter alkaliphilus]EEG79102.1 alpha/beta hydrolase fold protein [Dethiobacter alkaliphilus AHT 1]